ncbi:MAG TPA: hypothetical protein EYG76_00210 [Methanothermococcus okinawensis]|uniref:Glycosyl transferase family 28 C-terminal domain-containing protein n=1 Tax=Methanothermococcus okinawensis TaxID=155863 RepID=A0A833DQF5_9EURY|nr:hypothetical protein [Methanothermococcus okinawensis]
MKILISVCGEGFGHTTRCLAMGEELSKEHDIKYMAYGKSLDFIKKCNYDTYETYPEIKLHGQDGKFDIKKSIFNNKNNPTKAVKRELESIKKYKPDLIISDCKYSTVVVAKLLKIPFYIITNQNYIKTDKKRRFIVHPIIRLLNVVNKQAEGVIIPDLPMPYTVCEYNLTMLDNLSFIGPLVRYNLKGYEYRQGDYILSIIGGFEYRYRILELLNNISKKRDIKVKMVCGSYEVAERINKIKSPNVEVIPLTTDMENLIKNCSFIVCHGGHSTLMEAITFGKPVISIPDLDHPEQENNVKKINELKCGIGLNHRNLEYTLDDAIDEIINNKIYFKNAKKLSNICNSHNGRDNIRKIIKEYEKRMGNTPKTGLSISDL